MKKALSFVLCGLSFTGMAMAHSGAHHSVDGSHFMEHLAPFAPWIAALFVIALGTKALRKNT